MTTYRDTLDHLRSLPTDAVRQYITDGRAAQDAAQEALQRAQTEANTWVPRLAAAHRVLCERVDSDEVTHGH